MQAVPGNALLPKRAVVVTGASTGIGYGICAVLLQKGFRVFGSVRSQKDAERLQAELGAEAFTPLVFDVTNEAAVKAAAVQVRTLLDAAGTLTFLLHCLPELDDTGKITLLFGNRLTMVSICRCGKLWQGARFLGWSITRACPCTGPRSCSPSLKSGEQAASAAASSRWSWALATSVACAAGRSWK